MRRDFTIGLVVPFAADAVPDEGLQMYPDVRFIPRGVGVRSLTPTGYDSACEAILPTGKSLAAQGVDAIMVIGTSLTFYRGSDFHDRLMERLRAATGLPVIAMSQAVVDGLRSSARIGSWSPPPMPTTSTSGWRPFSPRKGSR